MNLIIFNLNDGSQKPCNLANLSRSLSPNCEIVRIIGDKHEAIGYVSHSLIVHFAIEWADYAYQNYAKSQNPKVQNCIDLTRKWVQDHNSVSADQLQKAYANAYVAVDDAYVANAAINAAYAATNAAHAATNAAINAAYAAGENKLDEQNRQGTFILKFFGME